MGNSSENWVVSEVPTFHRPEKLGTFLFLSPQWQAGADGLLILILIYLLSAIGLTPSSNSTVHINTQTIHRTTQ